MTFDEILSRWNGRGTKFLANDEAEALIEIQRQTLLQVGEQQKKYSDLLQGHHSLCGKIEELQQRLKDEGIAYKSLAASYEELRKQTEKRKDVCPVPMPFGQSGVPDFCGKPQPCPDHDVILE